MGIHQVMATAISNLAVDLAQVPADHLRMEVVFRAENRGLVDRVRTGAQSKLPLHKQPVRPEAKQDPDSIDQCLDRILEEEGWLVIRENWYTDFGKGARGM